MASLRDRLRCWQFHFKAVLFDDKTSKFNSKPKLSPFPDSESSSRPFAWLPLFSIPNNRPYTIKVSNLPHLPSHHKLTSATQLLPVTNPDASDAKNTASPFISSAPPNLPIGVIRFQCAFSPSSRASSFSAVSMYPGDIVLTRMPCCAHSAAKDLPRWMTAALEAL